MIKKARPGRPCLKKQHKIQKPAKSTNKSRLSEQSNEYKPSLSELEQTEDQASCYRSDFQQLRSIQQLANELFFEQPNSITHQWNKSDRKEMRNADQLARELFNEDEALELYNINQPETTGRQQTPIPSQNNPVGKEKQFRDIASHQHQSNTGNRTEIKPQKKKKEKKRVTFYQEKTNDLTRPHEVIQPKITPISSAEKVKDYRSSILNCTNQKLPNKNLQKAVEENSKSAEASLQQQISKIKKWKNEAAEARKAFSIVTPAYKKLIIDQPILSMPPECTIIRWDSLMEMYNIVQDCLPTLFYHMSAGENPFFSKVFVVLRTELDYAKIYKMRENNLAKMRTFIVRRVLDDFVAQTFQDSPEQLQHLAKHNRRITRFDRNRYQQIGIPEPPSRMKSQYLSDIFSNAEFKSYFIDYIQSTRLQDYLQSSNKKMKTKYEQEITHIAYKKISLEEKVDLFRKIKRKPLFASQILEYLDEGKMISVEYCNEKLDQINVH